MARGTPPQTHANVIAKLYYDVSPTSDFAIFYTHESTIYHNQFESDPVVQQTIMSALADIIKGRCATNVRIHSFSWTPFAEPEAQRTPLNSTKTGLVVPDGTATKVSLSCEVTLSGRGAPVNTGEAHGRWRFQFFPGYDYGLTAGEYRHNVGPDSEFATIYSYMNDVSRDVCNIYGQSTQMYTVGTIQFNSYVERTQGH